MAIQTHIHIQYKIKDNTTQCTKSLSKIEYFPEHLINVLLISQSFVPLSATDKCIQEIKLNIIDSYLDMKNMTLHLTCKINHNYDMITTTEILPLLDTLVTEYGFKEGIQ